MSAQKIAVREVHLCYSPSAISATRFRAEEINTTAAESAGQTDNGDGIGDVSAFPIPDPHGIREMKLLSLSAEVNRKQLAVVPLAGTGASRPKAALLRQLIDVERPIGLQRFASSVLAPP
jgi:hypothetical protein